jgi:hypothetical protein
LGESAVQQERQREGESKGVQGFGHARKEWEEMVRSDFDRANLGAIED